MLTNSKIPHTIMFEIVQALGWEEDENMSLVDRIDSMQPYMRMVHKMKPDEAFQKWCQWNGLLGSLSARIWYVVETLQEAKE